MQNKSPKKGWTPNWSSRGTAMLDFMETASITTTKAQRNDVSTADKHMLRDLLRNNPTNYFYKSLARQLVIKGGLTAKQVQSIHSDYEKLQIGMN